jgi:hypothetical protein
MKASAAKKKTSTKVLRLQRGATGHLSRQSRTKAVETSRVRREEAKALVTFSIPRRAADQLRAALGSNLSPARAALVLQVGERLIWETSAREFRSELTRVRLKADPAVKAMKFEAMDATTFINASLAFETCVIRRVE